MGQSRSKKALKKFLKKAKKKRKSHKESKEDEAEDGFGERRPHLSGDLPPDVREELRRNSQHNFRF